MTDLTPLRERLPHVLASLCHSDDDLIAAACQAWDRAVNSEAQAVAANAPLTERARKAETLIARLRDDLNEIFEP